jgi:ankyrin repeat protein
MNVALKLAAGEGHLAIAQALTAKGADPFAPSGANEKSALHRARQRKQPALVEFFKTLRQR